MTNERNEHKTDTDPAGRPEQVVITNPTWFDGEPELTLKKLVPVKERWKCPTEECDGEMIFNGLVWPCSPQGYHHTCNACGCVSVMRGAKYPRITYLNE